MNSGKSMMDMELPSRTKEGKTKEDSGGCGERGYAVERRRCRRQCKMEMGDPIVTLKGKSQETKEK